MRVPLSWLREYAPMDLTPGRTARGSGAAADRGRPRGRVHRAGRATTSRGVVVAQVREIEELTGFRKPIRYCRRTTGAARTAT